MGTWTYNVDDETAPNKGLAIAIVVIVFTILTFAVVLTRVLVRTLKIRAFGNDDWIICVTMLMAMGFNGAVLAETKWGLGVSIHNFPPQNRIPLNKWQYAGQPFYVLGLLGFKVALLLSYIRIVSHTKYKLAVYTLLGVAVTFHISQLFVLLFQCQPIAYFWDVTIDGGHCLPPIELYQVQSAIIITIDLLIIIAPIPLLWTSKINLRKKLFICGLFSLGLFVTVCQINRYRSVGNIGNSKVHESSLLILWSVIELNVAIITTCMPSLAPLFRRYTDPYSASRSRDIRLQSGEVGSYAKRRHTTSHQHSLNFSMPHGKVFPTRTEITTQTGDSHLETGSMERIVQIKDGDGILKRTEYEVRVEREAEGSESEHTMTS